MKKNGSSRCLPIRGDFIDGMLDLQDNMEACVCALLTEDSLGCLDFDRYFKKLHDLITSRIEPIKGNRPDTAPITWSDARYVMIVTLRTLLEKLEEAASVEVVAGSMPRRREM